MHSLLTSSTLKTSMKTSADTRIVWRVAYYTSIVVCAELHVGGSSRDELVMKTHMIMLYYNL